MPAVANRSPDDWTTDQVAAALGVSRGTVRRYIARGLLKARPFGRDKIIKASELNNFEKPSMGRPAVPTNQSASSATRCVTCGRILHKPEGRTQCWRCAPNTAKLTRAAELARKRRAERRAAGLCPECGKRAPERDAPWTCRECRRLRDQSRDRRRNGEAA